MSVKAISWAFDQTLPANEKLMLLALADYADDRGYSFPGIETLSKKTSMSVRTVRRLLVKLAERGLITRERRHLENGNRTSDGYMIVTDQGSNWPLDKRSSETDKRPTVTSTGEPSEEPSVVTYTRTRDVAKAEENDMFEHAWSAWPRKDDKKDARRAWGKAILLPGVTAPRLLADVLDHAAAYRQHRDKQFTPMLATWLNKERWNNPPVEAEVPAHATPNRRPTPTERMAAIMAIQDSRVTPDIGDVREL